MASHQEQSDWGRIIAELEHVKLENARFKLQAEIIGVESEFENWCVKTQGDDTSIESSRYSDPGVDEV
ncbi:hypothetical protein DPMN_146259 [Dreissena polymorpha]|uniref:Uncharacterized protein n=1 Tax=Dreissena polymorpha TaxID=45954 RepID=A0A9D4F5K6_DREPO|nr:hypothetical protein DPMN_146259 [Dreissena polymorpha]